MPLILLTGFPSSGKSLRASQLSEAYAEYANTHIASTPRVRVVLLNDNSDLDVSRSVYGDTRKEKDVRAAYMSAIKRALGKHTLVIADGLNYIKGWRYQVWCEAKAAGTTMCVVHVATPASTCKDLNDSACAAGRGYPPEVISALIERYEEPNDMNRWDRPLFTVLYDEPIAFERIWSALFGICVDSNGNGSTAVRQHQATVLKPQQPSDYLYTLDRATSDVIATIQTFQRDHADETGGVVPVRGRDSVSSSNDIYLPATPVTLPQLQRLRRQFIQLNRSAPIETRLIVDGFVSFLNTQFDK